MENTSLQQQLLEAGVHFGHLKKKWNPKMLPYIFAEKKGIHIIDLNKTVEGLQESAAALKAIENDGLIWPHHVIEPNMFESQLAKIYKIKSIPAKYLIGPDQIIMLADPSIRELDDFLAFQILKN